MHSVKQITLNCIENFGNTVNVFQSTAISVIIIYDNTQHPIPCERVVCSRGRSLQQFEISLLVDYAVALMQERFIYYLIIYFPFI